MIDTSERFIFVVGHCRGGSTMLGAALNWHSKVCSGFKNIDQFNTASDFVDKIYNGDFHTKYRTQVEQGIVWSKYLPLREHFTQNGDHRYRKNIISLTESEREKMTEELTVNCSDSNTKFMCKRPPLALQIATVLENFPRSKIIALCRNGEEVAGSYLLHGPPALKSLPMQQKLDRAILRWKDYLREIEPHSNKIMVVGYDSLVYNTESTLEKILKYLELPIEDYIYELNPKTTKDKWKKTIPTQFHQHLVEATSEGNTLIKKMENQL